MLIELRETVDADLPALFEHQADPEASAMAAFASRDRDAFMRHQATIRTSLSVLTRTIVADGDVAGSIVSWAADGGRLVGYWIGRAHWGRGIATAALVAFLELETTRPLRALVAEHNVGSRRVLEKCGFVVVRRRQSEDVQELAFELAS